MTIDFTEAEIRKVTDKFNAENFKNIEAIVLFVGHAHSGHSILGAMLDSHPETAIANELNIAKVIQSHKLSKQEVYSLLINHSLNKNSDQVWRNSEYKYNFKQMSQVEVMAPKVVGDKKAGGSTRIFYNHFWVFEHLLETYGEKLKLVFVNRNPKDIVAAYSYYMKQEPSQFHIDRYIENYETVMKLQKALPSAQWLTINQSEFINKPETVLLDYFGFFGLDTEENYIKYLSSFVRKDIRSKNVIIQLPEKLSNQLKKYQ